MFKLLTIAAICIALCGCEIAPVAEKPVTLSEFSRVSTGMSYVEVEKIIGFLGTEMSRSDLAGITTVMYSWKNDDGSNMNAMFQDGKLVTKAQFGLQ